jgi:hypothetical protein
MKKKMKRTSKEGKKAREKSKGKKSERKNKQSVTVEIQVINKSDK